MRVASRKATQKATQKRAQHCWALELLVPASGTALVFGQHANLFGKPFCFFIFAATTGLNILESQEKGVTQEEGVKYRFGELAKRFESAARANSGFKPVLLYHFCYLLFIAIRFASTNATSKPSIDLTPYSCQPVLLLLLKVANSLRT